MKRVRLLAVLFMALLLVAAWASDFVTLQGERIIYTAGCEGGEWRGETCTDRMVAGSRYRYHASKEKGEVTLQIVGSGGPAGRFSNCTVLDGRNWRCPRDDVVAPTWAVQMEKGAPVFSENSSVRSERRVSKWRWFVLDTGGHRIWQVSEGLDCDAVEGRAKPPDRCGVDHRSTAAGDARPSAPGREQ